MCHGGGDAGAQGEGRRTARRMAAAAKAHMGPHMAEVTPRAWPRRRPARMATVTARGHEGRRVNGVWPAGLGVGCAYFFFKKKLSLSALIYNIISFD